MADTAIVRPMQPITFHEVDASRWADLERLFESRGGPKFCWCMVWRAGAKTAKGPERKAAMKRYVCDGVPIGLLGLRQRGACCLVLDRPETNLPRPWRSDQRRRTSRRRMVVGLLFHSPRVARQRPDKTDDRGCGAARREARRKSRRSLSRRTGIAELPVHGLRVDILSRRLS
jgi:hypothetical protein